MNREYILGEIKRTATENGGTPLGRQAFQRETGIRNADWSGKYWARWGDAIREAGLPPNQKNAAYPEDVLLAKYVGLTRELGRVPVATEVRLKAAQDPSFPSHNTFARFGSKAELIQRVIQFCQNTSGFDDVLAMCAGGVLAASEARQVGRAETPASEMGYVYLIRSGRFYKIGKSNSIGRRERELAIQLPEKTATSHVIRTDDPSGIEAYWHARFSSKRKNGEWFDLSPSDVSAFKRRKFM